MCNYNLFSPRRQYGDHVVRDVRTIAEYGADCHMRINGDEPAPVPVFPSQIARDMSRDRTSIFTDAVGSLRLTVWTITRLTCLSKLFEIARCIQNSKNRVYTCTYPGKHTIVFFKANWCWKLLHEQCVRCYCFVNPACVKFLNAARRSEFLFPLGIKIKSNRDCLLCSPQE
jgi:hypothetical protein